MLVMATLFMWHCHQAVSPLSGLLLSNPNLSESSQVKFIIPRGEIKLQPGIKKHTTDGITHKIINSNGGSITTQIDKDEYMK